MNAIGYGVKLLDKEKCCGVPLVSNGFATQAKKHGEINMASMRKSVAEGRPILTTGTSCTLMMRNEYDHLLHIDNKVAQEHLLLATRFIYKLVEEGKVKLAFREDYKKRVCYHTACHMERLGWTIYSTSLVKMIPGIDFVMLDSMCCGIAGTYGFKKENYPISQKIGEPLFKQIEEAKVDNVITDCETCKWQIEMSTSAKVLNPISVLAEAIDYEKTKALNQ
jgi:glycerol-3-phosphate dehydrogenase subunit C